MPRRAVGMIDKVSRIRRITLEKNDHEQTKNEEEKAKQGQFEDMLEEATTDLVEENRGV
jgi:hypothetical protein